jgi:hypothetical protein
MSGSKGMHERPSTSPAYANAVRSRIKAGGIVVALHNHIVGKREMSASQVTAALGLLRKVVPDKTESKIDAVVRHGQLLSLEQAVNMSEAIIESTRRTAPSTSGADPVRHSEPA